MPRPAVSFYENSTIYQFDPASIKIAPVSKVEDPDQPSITRPIDVEKVAMVIAIQDDGLITTLLPKTRKPEIKRFPSASSKTTYDVNEIHDTASISVVIYGQETKPGIVEIFARRWKPNGDGTYTMV
jgi:hypothetical protein